MLIYIFLWRPRYPTKANHLKYHSQRKQILVGWGRVVQDQREKGKDISTHPWLVSIQEKVKWEMA